MKKLYWVVLLLSIAVFLIGVGIFALFIPTRGSEEAKIESIHVVAGETATSIGHSLKQAGLIRNETLFNVLIRLSGASKKIPMGTYKIRSASPMLSIVKKFVQGDVYKIKITIPEGYTSRMIADLMEKNSVCTAQQFLAKAHDSSFAESLGIRASSVEGFLYPDTYFFQESEAPDSVLRAMVSQFWKTIASISPGMLDDFKTLDQNVILASIIEREYRVPSEAKVIASVFINRLKIGMALQSCATVVYVMTEQYGMPHPDIVYYSDLALKSKYNTYLHPGLPPGPISNPGRISLEAVFNPSKSDYLYFRLADPLKGTHIFSRTFQEHSLAATRVKGF
jgi:UPF0755 protein